MHFESKLTEYLLNLIISTILVEYTSLLNVFDKRIRLSPFIKTQFIDVN